MMGFVGVLDRMLPMFSKGSLSCSLKRGDLFSVTPPRLGSKEILRLMQLSQTLTSQSDMQALSVTSALVRPNYVHLAEIMAR